MAKKTAETKLHRWPLLKHRWKGVLPWKLWGTENDVQQDGKSAESGILYQW